MRRDYQDAFMKLCNKLHELGYIDVRESDLLAEFRLTCDWRLLFKCERYYGPAFTVAVVPPEGMGRSTGYAVWPS